MALTINCIRFAADKIGTTRLCQQIPLIRSIDEYPRLYRSDSVKSCRDYRPVVYLDRLKLCIYDWVNVMVGKKSLEESQVDARLPVIAMSPEVVLALIVTVPRDRPVKLVGKSDDHRLAYAFIYIRPGDTPRHRATDPVCRLYENDGASLPSGGNCGGNAAGGCTVDTNIRSHV